MKEEPSLIICEYGYKLTSQHSRLWVYLNDPQLVVVVYLRVISSLVDDLLSSEPGTRGKDEYYAKSDGTGYISRFLF